jgi:hypothetical protein
MYRRSRAFSVICAGAEVETWSMTYKSSQKGPGHSRGPPPVLAGIRRVVSVSFRQLLHHHLYTCTLSTSAIYADLTNLRPIDISFISHIRIP